MTLTSALYKNLRPIGGNWTSIKTGIQNTKYLNKNVETICGKQKTPSILKVTVLPENHPLKKGGISEIVMEKSPLGKAIMLIDNLGEIVAKGVVGGAKEPISALKKDIASILQGKLKF